MSGKHWLSQLIYVQVVASLRCMQCCCVRLPALWLYSRHYEWGHLHIALPHSMSMYDPITRLAACFTLIASPHRLPTTSIMAEDVVEPLPLFSFAALTGATVCLHTYLEYAASAFLPSSPTSPMFANLQVDRCRPTTCEAGSDNHCCAKQQHPGARIPTPVGKWGSPARTGA